MLSAGATFERYEVVGLLGQGSMAHVYLVRHRVLGSEHVLKVLKDPSLAGRARLVREGQVQARLKHPHVVEVTDLLEVQGAPALVMERVDGPSLDQVLAAGRLAPERIEALVPGICAGLAAAHAFGVVHRDLKPANVLLELRGDTVIPKIADFGLVKRADRDGMEVQTATGATMGTPVYMAPEQVRGTRDVDARADVWALGAMLYELATGRRAFRGLSVFAVLEAVVALRFVPPEKVDPTLPSRWCDAIGSCLQALDRRAPSVEAVLATWRGGEAPAPLVWPSEELARLRERIPTPAPGSPETSAPPPSVALTQAPPSTLAEVASVPLRLPRERDVFVGRETELAALGRRLEAGARLVTVLGFGGAGKTRLVTRFGWTAGSGFPGGVWFCDLSEARDANGVVEAVARALDVPLGAQDPVVQLGHAIAGRGRCLLLLDNAEQVTSEASALLGRWLDRASDAVFVVTSRVVLGLPGEHVLALDPLPAAQAAALFVVRATQAKPDFVADDPASIAALVQLLDGLPLAIELAAARSRVMAPAHVLARMSERFRLLASASGRPARQATLRGALDWSWGLLSTDEQQALAQLSVFEAGFTLEAAEAVLSLEGMWPPDAVQGLVDRSLVRVVGADRFDLLISVREYAAERLDTFGGRTDAEGRHGAFFARLGSEEALDGLFRHGGVALRRQLREDRANLTVASRRAVARGAGEVAVATALAVWEVLSLEGPFAEARSLAEAVHAMADLTPQARVRAARMLGRALRLLGLGDQAVAPLEEALVLAREVGDPRGACKCLGELSLLHWQEGRLGEARRCAELARETDNRHFAWIQRSNLAVHAVEQGGAERALAEIEAALGFFHESGDRRNEGIVVGTLGNAHAAQGRWDQALASYEQALAVARELGDRRFEARGLGNLGTGFLAVGRHADARVRFQQALALTRELGDRTNEGAWLGNLGLLELAEGRHVEAGAHLTLALGIAREVGSRRLEGVWHGGLGSLHLREGRLEAARSDFDAGAALLRDMRDAVELGKLLSQRARLEVAEGRAGDAQATLAEVEALVEAGRVGPDSELARALAEVRAVIATRGA